MNSKEKLTVIAEFSTEEEARAAFRSVEEFPFVINFCRLVTREELNALEEQDLLLVNPNFDGREDKSTHFVVCDVAIMSVYDITSERVKLSLEFFKKGYKAASEKLKEIECDLSFEASDLGFNPGEWPEHIMLMPGRKFKKSHTQVHANNGIEWVDYECGALKVRVFND